MATINAIRQHFHAIKSPALPLSWLDDWLLWVLEKPRSFLISHDDYVLNTDEYQKLNDGIAKMQAGTPLAYLMGRQAFWRWDFLVNEHTLIPRPDTEILVQTILTLFAKQKIARPARILDLGTGSGCIAISLALELPDCQVLAVDKSVSALAIAKQNAQNLNAKVSFEKSDWYDKVNGRFDVIVANPPYIRADDPHLAKLTAEPMTALVAGDDGLSDIDRIIRQAHQHLAPQGVLAIEHGYDQKHAVQDKLAQANFCHITTIKDFGGNDRVSLGRLL